MQDKHSNRSSQVEDEYEEELSCLRNKIASQQYQLNDLKTFVMNQKSIHVKELQQMKATYNQTLQQTVGKYQTQISALSSQLEATRQESSVLTSSHTAIEVASLIRNELENRLAELSGRVQKKLACLCERFGQFDKLIRRRLTTLLNMHYEKSLQVMSINKELEDRSKLLDRQKRFLERIVEEKQESDEMYQKQLYFLEEVGQQRKQMCHHLERVNQELQNQNNSLRQQFSTSGRRKTDVSYQPTSVYINLGEEEEKRPTKILQISHTTERGLPGPKKSFYEEKQTRDSLSNKTSPLRSMQTFDINITANSPSQRVNRQNSICKKITKQVAPSSKRQLGRTIDICSQKPKLSRGKENFDAY